MHETELMIIVRPARNCRVGICCWYHVLSIPWPRSNHCTKSVSKHRSKTGAREKLGLTIVQLIKHLTTRTFSFGQSLLSQTWIVEGLTFHQSQTLTWIQRNCLTISQTCPMIMFWKFATLSWLAAGRHLKTTLLLPVMWWLTMSADMTLIKIAPTILMTTITIIWQASTTADMLRSWSTMLRTTTIVNLPKIRSDTQWGKRQKIYCSLFQIDFEEDNIQNGSTVQQMQTPVQTIVKAKRGRPPSKPPSKEVLKSRRKVHLHSCDNIKQWQRCIFWQFGLNFAFIFTNLLLYRQLMPERGEEWIEWTKLFIGMFCKCLVQKLTCHFKMQLSSILVIFWVFWSSQHLLMTDCGYPLP